ncbi:HAD hydrolase-like protein [Candidatus Gracilibacteria bacterium]|nr:HAD hydrolase-like protein [Candidatus Gracilibacteria bacterium]
MWRLLEDKMSITQYLILDFDGVIGDTFDACVLAYLYLEPDLSIEEAKMNLQSYFDKPAHCLQNYDPSKNQKKEVFGEFCLEYGRLFDGFVVELKKLQDTKMAVVSSGSEIYVKKFCKQSGINFDYVLGYEEHHSKEVKVQNILNSWGISAEKLFILLIRRVILLRLVGFFQSQELLGLIGDFIEKSDYQSTCLMIRFGWSLKIFIMC